MLKGTLNVHTRGGREASVEVEVIENKGVNAFEIETQLSRVMQKLNLHEFPAPHVAFIQIPSKMNNPGFQIEDEDPYQ